MRLILRLTAVALAAATLYAGVRYGSKVAGGSDSYGYVSQADLFLSGRLSISQPWVEAVPWPNLTWSFTPLAYRPGPGRWIVTPPIPHQPRDRWAIVPTYAPGLPLLMAGAKFVAGHCAVFWVVPICGALLVAATYGIGERMGSPLAGLIAAWLVATSPTVQRMVLEPMSDVPAADWAVAFWCLFGRSIGAAAGAGLATALAIMIRPNLVPLAIVPIGWQLFLLLRSALGQRARAMWGAAAVVGSTLPEWTRRLPFSGRTTDRRTVRATARSTSCSIQPMCCPTSARTRRGSQTSTRRWRWPASSRC